ncbi:glutamate ligase domain-containing protein [Candidatus Frankia nodulisporulans]|uniref:glutamate ligase domain-containing protein n=1 Tax=Candidatus Frankia nodulisporulans TaxID=2060052 RepID=UPI001FD421EF|nr:cyanophycin synthetase [Candidatus Frankia nodulisporulans]
MTGATVNAGSTPDSGSPASPGQVAWSGPSRFAAAYARRAGVTAQPGLERLRRLLDLLGQPQRSFPSIVVAGSVGKSSTLAVITALLEGFGVRAGSLRAPDWLGPAEQVGLGGARIPADVLERAFDDIEPYLPLVEDDGHLGARELLLAVAIAAFADAPVDLAVIESGGPGSELPGAGGFGDLADLLDVPVAAVTPVAPAWSDAGWSDAGWSDAGWADSGGSDGGESGAGRSGDDWSEDGGSDGGGSAGGWSVDLAGEADEPRLDRVAAPVGTVIRFGTLVVLAQQALPAARALLRRAALAGSTVAREGMEFGVLGRRVAVGGQMITLKGLGGTYEELFLPLHGAHQAHDAAVGLAAVEAFLGGGQNQLDLDIVRAALAQVDGRGRLEVVRRSPTIVLDVADSPPAVTAVVEALHEAFGFDSLVAVVAVEGDEATAARMLAVLEPVLAAVVLTDGATAGALPVDDLAAVAGGVFGADRIEVTPRLDDALDDAVRLAEAESELGGAGVLVLGSAPVVGRARALLRF